MTKTKKVKGRANYTRIQRFTQACQ